MTMSGEEEHKKWVIQDTHHYKVYFELRDV